MKTTHEQGSASPASLSRSLNSTYFHIPTGKEYTQKTFPQGNQWVENGASEEEATTKVFRAIYKQFGTNNAPQILEVLENTYGVDPVITYDELGVYTISLAGAPFDKTTINGTESSTFWQVNELGRTLVSSYQIDYVAVNDNEFRIETWSNNANKLNSLAPDGYGKHIDGAIPFGSYIHIETKK